MARLPPVDASLRTFQDDLARRRPSGAVKVRGYGDLAQSLQGPLLAQNLEGPVRFVSPVSAKPDLMSQRVGNN